MMNISTQVRCALGGGRMTTLTLVSTGGPDDATLVRSATAGDRAAFAAIYDRYADRLHDFCVGMLRDREAAADCVQDVFVTAATKLSQLREPDRLRPWLYAIARSEALARIRSRRREQPSEELPDMPSGDADLATMAARTELAQLIADASGGLSERDRTVLELAYRQGLDGPDLADALGVTARNANTLVERMRDTIARSLGALLVCRRAKADPERCAELAALLGDWDGQFTVLMRKRVARHIDGCAVCEEDRAGMVSPAALLGATPVVIPAPEWLRERTLDQAVVAPAPALVTEAGYAVQSWWPEPDLDTSDLAASRSAADVPAPAARRGRAVRAGLGAALVLVGIGGAVALATPAAFRTVPVDNQIPLSTSAATTTTTTPSMAQRIAPSTVPSPAPPVITTTDETVPIPAPPPPVTTEVQTTTEPPPTTQTAEPPTTETQTQTQTTGTQTTTTRSPVTKAPVSETDAPEPEPQPEPDSPTPTKPTLTVPKAPPADVGPTCPPTNPECNGGGPVFS
jgi:RNA polymerase sigma factor (sigma-70 family)